MKPWDWAPMSLLSRILHIADPRGRCNRRALLGIALALLTIQTGAFVVHSYATTPLVNLSASAIELACLWIAISASIKRLHDLNFSGWWMPASLLALCVWAMAVGFITLSTLGLAVARVGSPQFMVYATAVMIWPLAATLWLHFAEGTEGPNKYGYEPDETGVGLPIAAPRASASFKPA
jgi:uncharacterized membrane protein YhaH (DUF805 family)